MPDGLSAHLCVKGYFGELGDLGVLLRRVGQPEAYFYRDLAAATGVRTLRAVFADVDPDTQHGVIITGDVVAQGARFLDTRDECPSTRSPTDSRSSRGCMRRRGRGPTSRTDPGWRRGSRGPCSTEVSPRSAATSKGRSAWACRRRCVTPNDSSRRTARSQRSPRKRACGRLCTVIRTLPTCSSMRRARRGSSTGSSSSALPGTSTSGTTSRRRCRWKNVGARRRISSAHYLEHLTAAGIDAPSWDDGVARRAPRNPPRLLPLGDHAQGRPGNHGRVVDAPRQRGRRPRCIRSRHMISEHSGEQPW